MSSTPYEPIGIPSHTDSRRLHDIVDQFEQAWRDNPDAPPQIPADLPPDEPLRTRILVELLKTDLEFRHDSARVDDYLAQYPEIAKDTRAADELRAWAEQLLRNLETDSWWQLVDSETLPLGLPHAEGEPTKPEGQSEPISFHFPPSVLRGYLGQLGHYHLLKMLGAGSMGAVFLAEDARMRRLVAIKVPRPQWADSERFRRRFKNEARISAQVHHENVVRTYHVETTPGFPLPYLVMEYVDGQTLEDYLKQRKMLPVREAAEIAAQVALGLAAAHKKGLVHRDLKPSNILVEKHSGKAKLTDFGLARAADGTDLPSRSGGRVGTTQYMSPEQIQTPFCVDNRSDIFSFGIVLYEMLAGERPFAGSETIIVKKIVNDQPKSPREFNDKVDRDLETITLKCLAKDPAQRYKSASEVAEDLRLWLKGEPTKARPPGAIRKLWGVCRRKPGLAFACVLAAVALVELAFILFPYPIAAIFGWGAGNEIQGAQKWDGRDIPLILPEFPQRQIATAQFDLALKSHKEGEVGPAMHRLVECLESAPPRSEDLCRRIRLKLNNFRPHLPPVRSILLQQTGTTTVAFTDDGSIIATTTSDRTICLWNALQNTAPPTLRAQLKGRHRGVIIAIAFSPSKKILATADDEGKVWLWNVDTGKPLLEHPCCHARRVSAVTFAPDSATVVMASHDNTVRLWEVATGKERPGSPLSHPDKITSVAISSKGKVLTGCCDGRSRLWELSTGQPLNPVLEHGRKVMAVAFSPDGTIFATATEIGIATENGIVQLWLADSKTPLGLALHPGDVTALAFSSDGTRLVTGCSDNNARLWEVPAEVKSAFPAVAKPISLMRHQGGVTAVGLNSQTGDILTASTEGFIRSWQVPGKNPCGQVPISQDATVEQLRVWVEVLTAMALDGNGEFRALTRNEWEERKERFKKSFPRVIP
jgi:WD40 repeat protein